MHIHISIKDQSLTLTHNGELVATYIISSASNGIGCEEGSYCTPTGRFEIREKIGGGAELGTVFRSRKPERIWTGEEDEGDLVLTRILRLDGMDPENANSMERYIYIHGTNHENTLGTPASCGCIRMGNTDVADLYDRVLEGTSVVIEE